MNHRDVLEFGPVRVDEIEQTNALLEQALTFPLGEMAQWTTEFGHENVRVVRRNGRVVSGMGIIPMGHYFGGRSVPAGGITAVGVAPDQRGSGVGLFMLQQSLIEQQRQGSPIATLYPATTNFYRRSGFERAAHRIIYEVPLAGVGVRDYTLDAAPAAPEEYALIKQLYAQKAAQSSALIDRPGFYWDTFLEPKTKRSYKFIVRRDGVPEGGCDLHARQLWRTSSGARLRGAHAGRRSPYPDNSGRSSFDGGAHAHSRRRERWSALPDARATSQDALVARSDAARA